MRFGSSAFFKNIIFTTFILVASAVNRQGALMAQGFMGFHSDNYSGVHSLQWNPALLVDNRLAFQINLSSSHFTVTNNYIGINTPSFLGDIEGAVNNSNFVDDFLVERLNGKEKNGLVRANYT
ncbi:MAG: hypothetical protein VXY37_08170, partial [Bacteroidota bacterium]|nr:hypothetical protein [Bacteroidota bacterium]